VFRVAACIVNQHDYRLVLLALLLCAATSFTAFYAYWYATQEHGARRLAWVFLTAVCTGTGIWATHFVAMLAYNPGYPISYDAVLTIASLSIAAVVAMVGFALSTRDGRPMVAAGGAIIGAGIGLMHFTGMAALVVPGTIRWDTDLVVAANAIGIGLTAAALLAWHELERRKAIWAAAGLLTAAIYGLHFTAMGAATIVPDPTIVVHGSTMAGSSLAIAVTAVTMVVMLAVLAMTLIVSQAERAQLLRNQELVDAALEGLVVAKDGKIVNVNQRLLELTRRSPAELLGTCVVGDLLTGAIETVPPSSKATEASLETATGIAIPVEVVCRPLLDGARGDAVYAIRDLTERRRVGQELRLQNETLQQREEELRIQNRRFEVTLANMPHGLTMIDAERRLVVCNKRYVEMYDLPTGLSNPGTRIEDIFEYLVVVKGLYSSADGEEYRRDGTSALFEPTARTRHLSDGRVLLVSRQPTGDGGWIAIHEDITERERLSARLEEQNGLLKRHEAELQAQNANLDMALAQLEAQKANLDTAISNMSQGMCLFDAQQRVVFANNRYAEVYGLTPEQVKPGTSAREIIEARMAKGAYRGEDAEHFVGESVARFGRCVSEVLELRDGRFVSAVRLPMPGGGVLSTHEDITEREQLTAQLARQNELLTLREQELNARNEQLDAALENMLQGLAMYDAEQRLIICNRRYAEMYGLTPEQVKPGTSVRQIFEYRLANGYYHVKDTEDFVAGWARAFGESSTRIQELADGRTINVLRRRTASGGRVITHEDITERQKLNARLEEQNRLLKQQEEKLTAQNVQLDAALNNMLQGLAMYDAEQRLVVCNNRYAEIYGLEHEQVKPGTPLRAVIEHRIASGEFPGKSAEELIQGMVDRTAGGQVVHYNSHLSDGRHIAVSVLPMPDGSGTVTTHHDITEQRRSEAKIAHMALHDTLTGLPNRVLLNERLQEALRRVKRDEIVAVHLLDLDHFKTVNDTLGHPAGDQLLRTVAERLRALVRETDTVARMGGDEFFIVQTAIAQPADAISLAHRVIEAVSAPYLIEGHQVVIGTSVGIAVGPSDGLSPEQLMRNADLALYRAKADGRGTYRFFEREMDAQTQARRSLEDDLRKALPAGEFELYYQPVVNLASNEIRGFEALIRWRHPEKGLVLPRAFIPLAEEIGFIIPLGEWAIRQACTMAAKWPSDIRVAVNLSPAQFRSPGLVQVVLGALAASGLAADRLELEITESTLLQDSEATLSTLYQLRALGVRIAMDDFGTGYSSLSYLQSFPFDKIKIDRTFVKDIADGAGSLNIVRAVAAMANGLGMETTAEGVETKAQLDTVRAEGCTEIQGFVFSRPLPADKVEQFLRQWDSKTDKAANPESAASAA
jgi:diguanylate cyclase (GGDEF)-like protein